MKQTDFIEQIEEDYDLSPKVAKAIYATLVDMIQTALINEDEDDGEVDLKDLMKITVTRTKPRMGRNPRTGKKLKIAARNRLSIKPKASLKKLINE
jgi:nucleoid DNA-binding protein